CPAFNFGTCACAIYAERPARCRTFECRQLLGVCTGTIPTKKALRQIRAARKLVSKIEKLLGQLGFNDAKLPLKSRFQKCLRAAESGKIPAADLEILARLQLVFHRLNLLLAEKFL
ncbi:MAG TPA: hypothetical protein VFC85_06065, partial [Verrucomicrobiae bacterium]|nr:hypothetical protein [Verrucomicrobiae bacterium]